MKAATFGFVFVSLIYSASLHAWGGVNNYDDCLLEGLKGTTSDAAARGIYRACRSKFPKKVPDYKALPSQAVAKLSGRVSFGGFTGQDLVGRFYNGSEWEVATIEISINDTDTGNSRIYSTSFPVPVSPKETYPISIPVIETPENANFAITGATGLIK